MDNYCCAELLIHGQLFLLCPGPESKPRTSTQYDTRSRSERVRLDRALGYNEQVSFTKIIPMLKSMHPHTLSNYLSVRDFESFL